MSEAHAAFPLEPGSAAGNAWDETLARRSWSTRPGDAVATGPTMAAVAVPTPPAPAPAPAQESRGLAPSGWYPEPRRLRYWDGRRWTDETRFAGPPAPGSGIVLDWPERAAAPPPVRVLDAARIADGASDAAPGPRPEHEDTARRGILRELSILMVVALLALAAGAAVATLGIVFTV